MRSVRRPPAKSAARRTRARPALACAAVASAALAGLALLLVPYAPVVAVAVAFVAGVVAGLSGQGGRERPLSPRETPARWAARIRAEIPGRYVLAAALLGLSALAVLLSPSLERSETPQTAVDGPGAEAPFRKPAVKPLRRALASTFVVSGAAFRVFLASPESWAGHIVRRPPGADRRWVLVGVAARNIERSRLNPNRLAYRLRDAAGDLYFPDVSGGTGPLSLAREGALSRGESAETRLAFRVPRSARELALVFEPVVGGPRQVQVPLSR